MKNKFLTLFLTFFIFNYTYSQNCNCTSWPVKKDCEKECGLLLLQTENKSQIVKYINLKPETADKIVHIKNRKIFKKIEDFKNDLAYNAYTDLENKFNTLIGNSNIQTNTFGDNVGGNQTKTITIVNDGNPYSHISKADSIRWEMTERNIIAREDLAKFLLEGYTLEQRCGSDSNTALLNLDIESWRFNVSNYLEQNLEFSFAVQFALCKNLPSLSYNNVLASNVGLMEWLGFRTRQLDLFITTLRNNPQSQIGKRLK